MSIKNGHKTTGGPNGDEYLEWIDLDHADDKTIYPDFYKTEDLDALSSGHFISRDNAR